jgi:hypothetical protein
MLLSLLKLWSLLMFVSLRFKLLVTNEMYFVEKASRWIAWIRNCELTELTREGEGE